MLKKTVIAIISVLILFIISGCNGKDNIKNIDTSSNVEKEKSIYIKYVQELSKINKSSEELPFDINVDFKKLTDEEIRYQVTIDNPKNEIKNIKAVAIHNKQTDDVFPSIGIFDKTIDLNVDSHPSGAILVGYIPYEGEFETFSCEVKVLVSYKINETEYKNYFVTKK